MKQVGVLGSGQVGQVLADGFLKHGYAVKMGTRTASKLDEWKANAGEHGSVGSFAEAAAYGEIVVLAGLGRAAKQILEAAGAENLAGKTVIDATNPIAEAAPDNGVIRFFTEQNSSLMEELQAAFPKAHLVKAFSCVGNAFMVNPTFPEGRPTMFICGDEQDAKDEVGSILDDFGWDVADFGGVQSARAIEPLCMLWCIPGMLRGEWTHAFRLLQQSPQTKTLDFTPER